jgi:hypothetical protein
MSNEKPPFLWEWQPISWENAKFIMRSIGQTHIFRGQENANWSLSSSLERSAKRQQFPRQMFDIQDKLIVDKFWRRAHQYINNPPLKENYLEWLSIIQHYGGPTRLIDFTKSFYIAAFFAVEKNNAYENNSAIWIIHDDCVNNSFRQSAKFKENKFTQESKERYISKVIGLDIKPPRKLVFSIAPSRLNERLAIQQSHFLCASDLTIPFLECMAETCDEVLDKNIPVFKDDKEVKLLFPRSTIIKCVIPGKSRKDVLDDLKSMNITATSLFPGLDGFARSLHYELSSEQINPDYIERFVNGIK